jgi:hypothetical protein
MAIPSWGRHACFFTVATVNVHFPQFGHENPSRTGQSTKVSNQMLYDLTVLHEPLIWQNQSRIFDQMTRFLLDFSSWVPIVAYRITRVTKRGENIWGENETSTMDVVCVCETAWVITGLAVREMEYDLGDDPTRSRNKGDVELLWCFQRGPLPLKVFPPEWGGWKNALFPNYSSLPTWSNDGPRLCVQYKFLKEKKRDETRRPFVCCEIKLVKLLVLCQTNSSSKEWEGGGLRIGPCNSQCWETKGVSRPVKKFYDSFFDLFVVQPSLEFLSWLEGAPFVSD